MNKLFYHPSIKNTGEILRHHDQGETRNYIEPESKREHITLFSKLKLNKVELLVLGLLISAGTFHLFSILEKKFTVDIEI